MTSAALRMRNEKTSCILSIDFAWEEFRHVEWDGDDKLIQENSKHDLFYRAIGE